MPADFMSFVRSALNAVNKKLDNIMIQQSKMETKLSDIEATVTGHATAIQTITETVRELSHPRDDCRRVRTYVSSCKTCSILFWECDGVTKKMPTVNPMDIDAVS